MSPFSFLSGVVARRAAVFAWCDTETRAEHAPKVRRAVEPVVERNAGHGAPALRRARKRARAGLEAPPLDVALDRLELVREEVVQVSRGHATGIRDLRGRELGVG